MNLAAAEVSECEKSLSGCLSCSVVPSDLCLGPSILSPLAFGPSILMGALGGVGALLESGNLGSLGVLGG